MKTDNEKKIKKNFEIDYRIAFSNPTKHPK